MKKVITLTVFLAALSLVGQGHAADWSSVLREVRAKYARYEKEVRDMTTVSEGEMILTEEEKSISYSKSLKKGKKFRTESTTQMPQSSGLPERMRESEAVMIYDGNDMWIISSSSGKRKMPAEAVDGFRMTWDWYEYLSENAEVVGTERIGERECYVVVVDEEGGPGFSKLWLDRKNLVLVRGEVDTGDGRKMLFVFSDFSKITGDFEMPYKTEMYFEDKLVSTTIIKSLDINTGISDDLFDPDKVEVERVEEITPEEAMQWLENQRRQKE